MEIAKSRMQLPHKVALAQLGPIETVVDHLQAGDEKTREFVVSPSDFRTLRVGLEERLEEIAADPALAVEDYFMVYPNGPAEPAAVLQTGIELLNTTTALDSLWSILTVSPTTYFTDVTDPFFVDLYGGVAPGFFENKSKAPLDVPHDCCVLESFARTVGPMTGMKVDDLFEQLTEKLSGVVNTGLSIDEFGSVVDTLNEILEGTGQEVVIKPIVFEPGEKDLTNLYKTIGQYIVRDDIAVILSVIDEVTFVGDQKASKTEHVTTLTGLLPDDWEGGVIQGGVTIETVEDKEQGNEEAEEVRKREHFDLKGATEVIIEETVRDNRIVDQERQRFIDGFILVGVKKSKPTKNVQQERKKTPQTELKEERQEGPEKDETKGAIEERHTERKQARRQQR